MYVVKIKGSIMNGMAVGTMYVSRWSLLLIVISLHAYCLDHYAMLILTCDLTNVFYNGVGWIPYIVNILHTYVHT